MNNGILTTLLWLVSGVAAAAGSCQEPRAGTAIPAIAFEEIAAGFKNPVHVTAAFDGSGRLFVVEQQGVIRVLRQGQTLPEPFLDIRHKTESGGEKGLLSVAFHPRFRDNGYFYVDYTARDKDLYTIVSRFKTGPDRRADLASERVLLKIKQPYANHNGGQLAFGPDGYLYIGMGDGGSANDPHDHGQNRDSLLGKILRIDVDREDGKLPYAIPADNPFRNTAGTRPEIYALGFRNPWRFSFDVASGHLYAADVGQDRVEEINIVTRGGNYGWRVMEGDICTPAINPVCDARGYVAPIHVYRHPEGFSVTGGFVYRGRAIPALCGVYLYADYVTNRVWGFRTDGQRANQNTGLAGPASGPGLLKRTDSGALSISSFGENEERELYVTDHQRGRLLKIIGAGR
jgi:glucose/arabinose dehydrogenase